MILKLIYCSPFIQVPVKVMGPAVLGQKIYQLFYSSKWTVLMCEALIQLCKVHHDCIEQFSNLDKTFDSMLHYWMEFNVTLQCLIAFTTTLVHAMLCVNI